MGISNFFSSTNKHFEFIRKIFNLLNIPVAFITKKGKFIWISKEFNNSLSEGMKQHIQTLVSHQKDIKTSDLFLQLDNVKVRFLPIRKNKNTPLYVVYIPQQLPRTSYFHPDKIIPHFQTILKHILQDEPNKEIYKNILSNCLLETGSDFTAILLVKDKLPDDLFISDPFEFFENEEVFKNELVNKFPDLYRILEVKLTPIESDSLPQELRIGFVQKLESAHYIISPILVQHQICGMLLISKIAAMFNENEKYISQQFVQLIGMVISSIITSNTTKAIEAKESLHQRLDVMGKFAGTMAHDINNLLSGIFGSIELLKGKVDNSEAERLVHVIHNCAIKAKDLTKGLLYYGKASTKKWDVIKPENLLSDLNDYIVQAFPPTIEISFKNEKNLLEIEGNYTQIYQVLLNLCINASEALPQKKGFINITARNLLVNANTLAEFPLLEPGMYIHFIVEDNGTGIAQSDIERLFEPYFTTKQSKGGTGLGLYIVYNIVKAHNGGIEVESKINQGTRFDCYFPASPVRSLKPEISSQIVMLIDDEVVIQELLGELLESQGYDVIKVSSAIEALKILTEELQVSVIVVDFHLESMNGVEFIELSRKMNVNIPIIITTGDVTLNESELLEKFNSVKLLQKPFEFEELSNLIGTLC